MLRQERRIRLIPAWQQHPVEPRHALARALLVTGLPATASDPALRGRHTDAVPTSHIRGTAAPTLPLLRARSTSLRSLFLLAATALLLVPGLAFADVPVATITGPEVVAEGKPATYTVTLADGFGSEEIVISYEVTGTATAGLDYTAPNGKVTIGKQTDITKSFDIQTTADEVDEVGETLVVTLTGATTAAGKVAIGSPHQVTTMIVSGDTKVVTVEDNAANEGEMITFEGEMITFEVVFPEFQPVPDDGSVVTIAYATVDGDATAGVDYTAESGTLTLTVATSATTGSITVETKPDMLSEDDETLYADAEAGGCAGRRGSRELGGNGHDQRQ